MKPVTPAHMVHHHGYTAEHANQMSPIVRRAEHERLHEDETAVHLDHTHTLEGDYVDRESGKVIR